MQSAFKHCRTSIIPFTLPVTNTEAAASRNERDRNDLAKLEHNFPFTKDTTLIVTGINADTDVNAQNLFDVVKDILSVKWKDSMSFHIRTSLNR